MTKKSATAKPLVETLVEKVTLVIGGDPNNCMLVECSGTAVIEIDCASLELDQAHLDSLYAALCGMIAASR